jgi:hypothetical protein
MGSCQVTFLLSLIIQSYARQLNILTNRTIVLGVYSAFNNSRFGRLVVDWFVEDMTPDMTLCIMSLIVDGA